MPVDSLQIRRYSKGVELRVGKVVGAFCTEQPVMDGAGDLYAPITAAYLCTYCGGKAIIIHNCLRRKPWEIRERFAVVVICWSCHDLV